MNKNIGAIIAVVTVGSIIGLGIFLQSSETSASRDDSSYVSRAGLHWHADLAIMIKGQRLMIPAGIGLGTTHNSIHTHDEEPNVIHMEFPGVVRKDDLKLGEFFKIWEKDMRSFGANMKMTVNEKENIEFENYHMQDKDKIVLTFD